MILRVYRCSVVRGREDEFRAFAFDARHLWLRDRTGLQAFYAGRPMPDSDDRTRCMVQIWETPEALEAALGADWRDNATIPDDAREFIDSASVEHFEIADAYRADATGGVRG